MFLRNFLIVSKTRLIYPKERQTFNRVIISLRRYMKYFCENRAEFIQSLQEQFQLFIEREVDLNDK